MDKTTFIISISFIAGFTFVYVVSSYIKNKNPFPDPMPQPIIKPTDEKTNGIETVAIVGASVASGAGIYFLANRVLKKDAWRNIPKSIFRKKGVVYDVDETPEPVEYMEVENITDAPIN